MILPGLMYLILLAVVIVEGVLLVVVVAGVVLAIPCSDRSCACWMFIQNRLNSVDDTAKAGGGNIR